MNSEYPEHEKMRSVMDRSRTIGDFLDWLRDEKGVSLCKWQDTIRHGPDDYTPAGFYRINKRTENLLAEFFEIDLGKVEDEKRAMLRRMEQDNVR